jgi:hypothetical protein
MYKALPLVLRAYRYLTRQLRLSNVCTPSQTPAQDVREAFEDLPYAPPKITEPYATTHPHAVAAALRNSAVDFARTYSARLGLGLHVHHLSRADAVCARAGQMLYDRAEDLEAAALNNTFRDEFPKPDDLILCVDRDYTLDMENYLTTFPRNVVLMYTNVPNVAAGDENGVTFKFNPNGTFNEKVSGGEVYNHMLWDWTVSKLTVRQPWGTRIPYNSMVPRLTLGITVSYKVAIRHLNKTRALVLLVPYYCNDGWRLLDTTKDETPLRRFNPVQTIDGQTFTRISVQTAQGSMISTARCGRYDPEERTECGHVLAATVSSVLDDAIHEKARGTSNTLSKDAVKHMTSCSEAEAIILRNYHVAVAKKHFPWAKVVFGNPRHVVGYQWDKTRIDDDAKCVVEAFMSPLVTSDACAPMRTPSNEFWGATARVTNFQLTQAVMPDDCTRAAKKKATKKKHLAAFERPNMSRELLKCMESFLDEFMGDMEDLEHYAPSRYNGNDDYIEDEEEFAGPVDPEVVWARQSSRAQQIILDEADMTEEEFLSEWRAKVFPKAEVYNGIKPPRMITTIGPLVKMIYSMFIYRISAHIKRQHWYAFGLTPREVAQRVGELAREALKIILTDFSKFDGHVAGILREFERMLIMRCFPSPKWRSLVLQCWKSQLHQWAITAGGVEYDTGFARLSGSPETAAFNAMANALIAFYALWKTRGADGQRKYSPRQCYAKLGLYGGDDGLSKDIDEAVYKSAANEIGQVMTYSLVKRGDAYITFLGRVYTPRIWYYDISDDSTYSSMQDITRVLPKFHLTPRVNVPPVEKLVEKARAYYLTDANTPILGLFCRRVLTFAGDRVHMDFHKDISPFNVTWCPDVEKQYPNVNSDMWMEDALVKSRPDLEYDELATWLGRVWRLEDILDFKTLGDPQIVAQVANVHSDDVDYWCEDVPEPSSPLGPRG